MKQHYSNYQADKIKTLKEMDKPRADKPLKLSSLKDLEPLAYILSDEDSKQIANAVKDLLIYGRAVTHITKQGIKNLHPLTDIPKINKSK